MYYKSPAPTGSVHLKYKHIEKNLKIQKVTTMVTAILQSITIALTKQQVMQGKFYMFWTIGWRKKKKRIVQRKQFIDVWMKTYNVCLGCTRS